MTALDELVEKLQNAFSGSLVSVILYGSAAAPGQADRFSDLNVFCVLKQITPQELAAGEPVLRWWRQQGQPPPLLMSEEEVAGAADSFPIEFRDMQQRRKVLFGTDPIADLTVHDTHYRAQLEHELRTNLLRLRQQGAGVLSDQAAVLALCVASVSTFCVLGRHALALAGIQPPAGRREVVRALAAKTGADLRPFETLLDIREEKPEANPGDPVELFADYLVCIGRLIRFVDGLEKRSL